MGDTNLVQDFPLLKRGIPPSTEPISTPNMIDLGAEDIEFHDTDTSASHADAVEPLHNMSGLGICPFQKGAATYCGRTNKHVKNKSIQSRLDRIYVKIKRNSLKVHFYELTGTVTQPSDHYGVFAHLEF